MRNEVNINLANLLRESLLIAGCAEEMVKGFDDNSTIALEFNDQSQIYLLLDKEKNRIVAWSPICEANESILSAHAFYLIQKLLHPAPYSDSGQHHLKQIDDKFHIYCIFDNDCAQSPEVFLDALSGFFDFTQECTEVVK